MSYSLHFDPKSNVFEKAMLCFLFQIGFKELLTSFQFFLIFFLARIVSMVVNNDVHFDSSWWSMFYMPFVSFLPSPSTILGFCNLFICLIGFQPPWKYQLLLNSQMLYIFFFPFVHIFEPPNPIPCHSK